MKPEETVCLEMEKLLGPYYDGELSQEASGEVARHLDSCPRCRRRLRDYEAVGRGLAGMARAAGEGGGASLWPEIRRLLREESAACRPGISRGKFTLVLRPAWVGLGLSAAAALVLFFTGVFSGGKLPANYCRIDSITAPEHNLMIHRGQSDGLTIIWLTE